MNISIFFRIKRMKRIYSYAYNIISHIPILSYSRYLDLQRISYFFFLKYFSSIMKIYISSIYFKKILLDLYSEINDREDLSKNHFFMI